MGPEYDGCGDAAGGHEGVGTAVVSSMDAPPILKPAEHVLDLVSLAIEQRIVRDRCLPVSLCRDAGGDAALRERLAKPDRKRVVQGKRVWVRVYLGSCGIIETKKHNR